MVLGFRERVVSSDHNRLQAFAAADLADAFRHLFEASTTEDQAAGVATLSAAAASPMRAVVLNGFRVRPEIGNFNIFVDPGVALCVSPESPANPDDSVAQLVRDPGVTVAASLVISTPGGGVRVDVIEASISQLVVESDNRDIFNPSSGTFTPALINKVVEARFAYRVRAGTPGGGFPGTATGWLPLAVASVPSAAASCDDVTFWDVRPLLSDMARATHVVDAPFPRSTRQHAVVTDNGAGAWSARGIVDLELGGRKVGGDLCPTISGVSALRLDSSVATALNIQEPGFTLTADRPWYLYLALPFGLPRWAKYTPASVGGERRPTSPRGIPIFTQKAPTGVSGKAGSAISLPAATGLGSNTTNAVVALSGGVATGPTFIGTTIAGSTCSQALLAVLASGAGTNIPIYEVTGNVTHPAHACKLRVLLMAKMTGAAGTALVLDRTINVRNVAGTLDYSSARFTSTITYPASGIVFDRFEVELELPPNLPTGAPETLRVYATYTNVGTFDAAEQVCVIKGWTLP